MISHQKHDGLIATGAIVETRPCDKCGKAEYITALELRFDDKSKWLCQNCVTPQVEKSISEMREQCA